jgi:hypothetical protein
MDGPRAMQLKTLKMWSETVDYGELHLELFRAEQRSRKVLIHHNSGFFLRVLYFFL